MERASRSWNTIRKWRLGMKDLICVVADRNLEATLLELLSRRQSLGIRQIEFDVFPFPRKDPGCYHEAPDFLRQYRHDYRHGLVVFDRAWEGAPAQDALELEQNLRGRLGDDDWADVVVIDPELEAWVWSDSPHVDECLGWSGRTPALRSWLEEKGLWPAGSVKPTDPKEAVLEALRVVRLPRSSAIYRCLAQTVSLNRCSDAAFARLRQRLSTWFGV